MTQIVKGFYNVFYIMTRYADIKKKRNKIEDIRTVHKVILLLVSNRG